MEVLAELHRLTPANVYLDSIACGPGSSVVLRGGAQAMSDVLQLVGALEESAIFQGARSTRMVTTRGRVEFEVTCAMEKKAP
jgi:Tfp pilus assembly protein PilN